MNSIKYGMVGLSISALLMLSGCTSLFHPQAEEYYQTAKGTNARQTASTLLDMMEASAGEAKTEQGRSQGLDKLHDQFHAFHKTFCDFSDSARGTTAYEQAVTLNKALKAVFHRLWKFRQDPPLRNAHLDLLLTRIQELRSTIQAISD
jgi:hypothetical protein